MNSAQRWLVIASLVGIGIVLAFVFLQWGDEYSAYPNKKLFGFYDAPTPGYAKGIYPRYGIAGALLGLVAPLCLFVVAAFVYLGSRRTDSN